MNRFSKGAVALGISLLSVGGCTLPDLFFQRLEEENQTYILLGGSAERAVLRQNRVGLMPLSGDEVSPAFILDFSDGTRTPLDDAIPGDAQCNGEYLLWVDTGYQSFEGHDSTHGVEVIQLSGGQKRLLWPGMRRHDSIVYKAILADNRVIAMLRSDVDSSSSTLIHDLATGEERLLGGPVLIEPGSTIGDVAVSLRLRIATTDESDTGANAIDVKELNLVTGEQRTVATQVSHRYRPTDNYFVTPGHVVWMEAEAEEEAYVIMDCVRETGEVREVGRFVPGLTFNWLEIGDASDAGYVYQLRSSFPNADAIVFQPFEGNAVTLEGSAKSASFPGFVGDRILWSELASTGYRYYDIPTGRFGWY